MIPDHEIQIGSLASEAQRVAYARGRSFGEWSCDVVEWRESRGFQYSRMFDRNNTQAFMVWNDKTILIAFRGTELELSELSDIWHDLDCRKLDLGRGVEVFKGFNDYMNEVGTKVINKFHEVFKDHQVILAGHSLGAAAAQAFAFDHLLHYGQRNELRPIVADIHIHLFGSPRYGNAAFRRIFNKAFPDTYSWVNNADAVPHLPPAIPQFVRLAAEYFLPIRKLRAGGLRRVGKTCWFDVDGRFKYQPPIWWQWKDIARGMWDDFGAIGFAGRKDHSSPGYERVYRRAFEEKLEVRTAA